MVLTLPQETSKPNVPLSDMIISMSVRARLFVYSFITTGLVGMGLVFAHWRSADTTRFAILLILGALGSRIKFRLPRAQGNVTAGMVVVLMAIVELSPSEAMAI